jgi:NTE family protein
LSRATDLLRQCLRAATVLVVLLLLGCASLNVVDTTPLPQTKLEAPGNEAISSGGYRFDAFTRTGQLPALLVLVAISGGGKRSAAFSYGALKAMREVSMPVPGGNRTLLNELDGVSGVSGGNFTAAYYGLYRNKMFGQYERDCLYSDTNA